MTFAGTAFRLIQLMVKPFKKKKKKSSSKILLVTSGTLQALEVFTRGGHLQARLSVPQLHVSTSVFGCDVPVGGPPRRSEFQPLRGNINSCPLRGDISVSSKEMMEEPNLFGLC